MRDVAVGAGDIGVSVGVGVAVSAGGSSVGSTRVAIGTGDVGVSVGVSVAVSAGGSSVGSTRVAVGTGDVGVSVGLGVAISAGGSSVGGTRVAVGEWVSVTVAFDFAGASVSAIGAVGVELSTGVVVLLHATGDASGIAPVTRGLEVRSGIGPHLRCPKAMIAITTPTVPASLMTAG
jgi:hypothetical protein